MDLSNEDLVQRFESESFFIVDGDVPTGSSAAPGGGCSFGVDLREWQLGSEFRGLKMIPEGFHMIHFNRDANQRTVFLHTFTKRELFIVRYDPATEDFIRVLDEDVIDRYRHNLKQLDRNLAACPRDNRWLALTSRIQLQVLSRCAPTGRMSSMTSSTIPDETGITLEDQWQLHFTSIDLKRSFPDEATGAERSKYAQDKSWLLRDTLQRCDTLLAEMQLAFVCLLVGHNFEGFEQWKRIISVVCLSREALLSLSSFYMEFFHTLQPQLMEIPEDFFEDILSKDNFLRACIKHVYASIMVYHSDASLDPLRCALEQLCSGVHDRFGWDVAEEVQDQERLLDEDEGEDGPVVVDLDAGY